MAATASAAPTAPLDSSGLAPAFARCAPAWLRGLAWLTLLWNMAVVLWGAYVRASQSGAGCGAHWPLCNGEVVPHGARWHTYVEFTHRASSGVGLVLVVLLGLATFWQMPRRHLARWGGGLACLFMFNEALLGALLVLLRKVEMDQSWGRAVYLCLHSGNTLLLLGAITSAVFWLGCSPERAAWARYRRSRVWLPVLAGLAGTLWLAVTGAIAALGDTLFPATSLHQAWAQDFAANSHYSLRLRGLHPLSAVLMLTFVVWLLLRRWPPPETRWRNAVLVLFAVQFCLGLADIFLLAPIWLQIVHLLGADLFWVALVMLCLRILPLETPRPAAGQMEHTARA